MIHISVELNTRPYRSRGQLEAQATVDGICANISITPTFVRVCPSFLHLIPCQYNEPPFEHQNNDMNPTCKQWSWHHLRRTCQSCEIPPHRSHESREWETARKAAQCRHLSPHDCEIDEGGPNLTMACSTQRGATNPSRESPMTTISFLAWILCRFRRKCSPSSTISK